MNYGNLNRDEVNEASEEEDPLLYWGADSDLVRWALFIDVQSLFVNLQFDGKDQEGNDWD